MLKSEVTKYKNLLRQNEILGDKMIDAQSKYTKESRRNKKSQQELAKLNTAGWKATAKAFEHTEMLKKFVASMIKKYK